MLTSPGHKLRLPHNDLAYLAFRLALQETLTTMRADSGLEEESHCPAGYLSKVPFLFHVPLQIQIELLADAWTRHEYTEPIEASLLDAAIVYAACAAAIQIIEDAPQMAVAYFRNGPRDLKTRILRNAAQRLESMYDAFWNDDRFLLLDELQDLPPKRAATVRAEMRITDEDLQPMYDAFGRWHVSPNIAANLPGLLSDTEIVEAMPVLRLRRTRARNC